MSTWKKAKQYEPTGGHPMTDPRFKPGQRVIDSRDGWLGTVRGRIGNLIKVELDGRSLLFVPASQLEAAPTEATR